MTPQSNEQWLASRIRWLIARGREDDRNELPTGWKAPPAVQATDVEELTASWDVRFVITGSGRRRIGVVVEFIRKFLQSALFPLLARMSEFNAASVRVMAALAGHASELEARHVALEERLARLEQNDVQLDLTLVPDDESRELRRHIADAATLVPGTIVVAGDYADFAELLQAAGHEVRVAPDGAAAAVEASGTAIGAVVLIGVLETTRAGHRSRVARDRGRRTRSRRRPRNRSVEPSFRAGTSRHLLAPRSPPVRSRSARRTSRIARIRRRSRASAGAAVRSICGPSKTEASRLRVVVATSTAPFIRGGAAVIIRDLAAALVARGHEVETVAIPFSSRPESLLDEMLAFKLFDVASAGDLLVAVRTPAQLLEHPNKVLWFIHHERAAYDLWGTKYHGFPPTRDASRIRDAVIQADNIAFRAARKDLHQLAPSR